MLFNNYTVFSVVLQYCKSTYKKIHRLSMASLNIISCATHRIPQWADRGASCDSSPAQTAPAAQSVGTG